MVYMLPASDKLNKESLSSVLSCHTYCWATFLSSILWVDQNWSQFIDVTPVPLIYTSRKVFNGSAFHGMQPSSLTPTSQVYFTDPGTRTMHNVQNLQTKQYVDLLSFFLGKKPNTPASKGMNVSLELPFWK